MHLALATDTAYLPWCATAMLSALRATPPGSVQFHVLHEGDLTLADRGRIESMVHEERGGVTWWPTDSRGGWLPSKGPSLGGRVSWLRVLLPDLLGDIDKVVYLDADTFVVDSLEPLWTTPIGDAPIAAVPNVVEVSAYPHVEALGITDPRRYFNAGVLVMNLARMRGEQMIDAVRAFVGEHGATQWFDQDALNVVYAGRWLDLAARWNAQNSFWNWPSLARDVIGELALGEAVARPGILHFEGPSVVKPWHYLCAHPFRHQYRAMLRETPWGDTELEERTVVTRMIRLLPPTTQLQAYARWRRLRHRGSAVAS